MTYDAKGNITTDEDGNQYAYDAKNRLVEERDTLGRPIAKHRYDDLPKWIIKVQDFSTDAH